MLLYHSLYVKVKSDRQEVVDWDVATAGRVWPSQAGFIMTMITKKLGKKKHIVQHRHTLPVLSKHANYYFTSRCRSHDIATGFFSQKLHSPARLRTLIAHIPTQASRVILCALSPCLLPRLRRPLRSNFASRCSPTNPCPCSTVC